MNKEENKKNVFWIVPYREPVLSRGEGAWVEDTHGKRYLDLMSGQFSLPLGHSHPEHVQMLHTQAKKLLHTSTAYLSDDFLLGVEALNSITHSSLSKFTFLSTGAEAVEFALRYAKVFTKKEGVAALTHGYHGLTLQAQSLSMSGQYARPMVQGSHHLPTPTQELLMDHKAAKAHVADVIESSQRALKSAKGSLAALIVEPTISVGGMIFPPKGYFQGLQEIAHEHEALLVFDECQTGLGRTGKWFGYEDTGVVPDILVLAKGAGLGLPTSAVVMKKDIAEELEGNILHYSSHQNDPISGVSLAFLIEYVQKNNLLTHVTDMGVYLVEGLYKVAKKFPILKNPRGKGLMVAFDLSDACFTSTINSGQHLISLLEKNGVLIQTVRRGRTFRVLPAYTIKKNEVDFFLQALEKSLEELPVASSNKYES